jgi:hypothetical protein
MELKLEDSQLKQFYELNLKPEVEMAFEAVNNEEETLAQLKLVEFDQEFANLRAAFPDEEQSIKQIEKFQSKIIEKVTLGEKVDIHPNEMIDAAPVGIKRPFGYMNCAFNSVFQSMMNTISLTNTISQEESEAAKQLNPLAKIYTKAQADSNSVAEGLDAQKIREITAPELQIDQPEIKGSNPIRQEDAHDIWRTLAYQIGVECKIEQTCRQSQSENPSEPTEITEPGIRLDLYKKDENFKDLMDGYFDETTENGQLIHKRFKKAPDTLVVQANRLSWSPDKGEYLRNTEILNVPETYTVPKKSTPLGEGKLDYQIKGCVIQHGSSKGGHYISLQKKPDGWYVVDDQKVKMVSNSEAKQMLKKGYLFFYEKKDVKPAKPLETPIKKTEPTSPTSSAYYLGLAKRIYTTLIAALMEAGKQTSGTA